MKATPYSKVTYSANPGVTLVDPILNKFISEDGGIVPGNMIALAGTKGAGKTTLCKKLQKELPVDMDSVFFALESRKGSVQRQTKRVVTGDHAKICDDSDYPTWTAFMEDLHKSVPAMVIVDSLQHAAKLLTKENGKFKYDNYAQIVEDLYNWKEKHNTIVILIVQLNGQGKVEGPEATVFDVDCPLKLTANPKTKERFLEAEKNRMGGAVGEPIFYEFVEDDRVIVFYTQDEWDIMKKGATISEMVNRTIENYLNAYKTHENYVDFKKEFSKEYNKIYNSGTEEIEIMTQTLTLIDELSKKYFK